MPPAVTSKVRSAALWLILVFPVTGCSLFTTRPVQEMSDTGAAIRAAREVQADVLAPDLFRRANELFFKAKREYKFKNFKEAQEFAEESRKLAEQAEFDAIRGGAVRSDEATPDPYSELPAGAPAGKKAPPAAKPEPYDYPAPQPIPADQYDQRMQEERARHQAPTAPSGPIPAPLPSSTPPR